jgi:hypothetical protein
MCAEGASEGIVSEQELITLTDLFCLFEGATHPQATSVKEARATFDSMVEHIYWDKVYPAYKDEVTSTSFYSAVRSQCRARVLDRFHCP